MDPVSLSKSLRNWRGEHPIADAALGFVPGVGQALDVQDMVSDPSVLSAIGFIPGVGDSLKSLFKLRKAAKVAKEAEKMVQVHKSMNHLHPRELVEGDLLKRGTPEKLSMGMRDDVYDVPESALRPHETSPDMFYAGDPSKAAFKESMIKPNPAASGRARGGPEPLRNRWSK